MTVTLFLYLQHIQCNIVPIFNGPDRNLMSLGNLRIALSVNVNLCQNANALLVRYAVDLLQRVSLYFLHTRYYVF